MEDERTPEVEEIEQELLDLAEELETNPRQLFARVAPGDPVPMMDQGRALRRRDLEARAEALCDEYRRLLRDERYPVEEIEARLAELLPRRVR